MLFNLIKLFLQEKDSENELEKTVKSLSKNANDKKANYVTELRNSLKLKHHHKFF